MSRALIRRITIGALPLSIVALAAAAPLTPALAAAAPGSSAFATTGPGLVISEVYLNGGSSGASLLNKFVELYNPTAATVSLAGDTLQYRAATSTVVPSGAQVFALSGTVAANDHFLIQLPGNGASSNPGAALPTPDLSTGASINPAAAGGTLYLAANTAGVLPTDSTVVDRIGWGTSNAPEGTATSGNSLVLSYQRSATGADTDDNSADFTAATPTPEHASTATPPSTPAPAPVDATIAQIQGTDTDTSPYAGKGVTTTGVVTAAYPVGGFNGFFVETGGADLTPGASDAVFVFGSLSAGQVAIGDSVQVTGTVAEFQGLTEITSPTVTKLTDALPAVVARALPWTALDTDAEKEAHEGELVVPQGAFTVSDNYTTNYYGSFTLAAGDKPLRQPTDAGRAASTQAQAVVTDNAARTITLDDGSSVNYSTAANAGTALPWLTPTNPVTVGAKVTFHQSVILDYRFSLWNLQPVHQITDNGATVATFSDLRTGNAKPANLRGARIATFNVENYFPTTGDQYVAKGLGTCTFYNDRAGNHVTVNSCSGPNNSPGPRGAADATNFARQQAKIVTGINRLGASIVSLEEVENSAWFGEPRDTALAGLVDALNTAAGAEVWAYDPSPAADKLPPLAQQDVIRTAFIYKPANVTLVGPQTILTTESDDGKPFSIAREPDAQGFKKVGTSDIDTFLVVANHWKSKGAGTPLYDGDLEDKSSLANDQGAFNATRVREAQAVVTFANQVATSLNTTKVFLVGDFNAYTQEDPMQTLYTAGYTDLSSTFDPSEQTYSYKGLQGSLDHVLASPTAKALVTGADIWQINAQEAVAYAYSRYNYNATLLYAADPFAASDHDPVVVGLTLPATAAWTATKTYRPGDTVVYLGQKYVAQCLTRNQTPDAPLSPWKAIS